MAEIVLFCVGTVATAMGVALFLRAQTFAGVVDVPNERSSHSVPTPRGGGLAVVAVCLSLYFSAVLLLGFSVSWSYVIGSVIIASVSWIDDVYGAPVPVRFVAHSAAALIVIVGCGAFTSFQLPGTSRIFDIGWMGHIFTFLWIVWLINAYNFMDGIDGIAGGQAVAAGLAWAAFGYSFGDTTLYFFGIIIASSCLGFLFHNWSPGSIFLGDVGSAFLGFTFASIPLLSEKTSSAESPLLLPAGIVFVWLFLFDSVITLIRRLLKGERVWTAHRQHLYQRLVISGKGHGFVAFVYSATAVIASSAFLFAVFYRGIAPLLLVFVLLGSAAFLAVFAFRKKV